MIGHLARDSVRLLLRGRVLFLLIAVGLLAGLFVRATRDTGAATLAGAELRGAAVETLIGTLFMVGLIYALVAGLVLAAEDRGSGFLTLIAVRPVGRLVYVGGRLVGLVAAVVPALLLFTGAALAVVGLTGRDLPRLFETVRAESVTVGGRTLAGAAIDQIAAGRPGRFLFAAGNAPAAVLRYRLKTTRLEGGFSGLVDLALTLEQPPGGERRTITPAPFRPRHELDVRFDSTPSATPFVLEVEPAAAGYVLEVDRDSMTIAGAAVPLLGEAVRAFVLLALAALVAAALAFLAGIALSPGPASLAASFVLLIGMGREAVLDMVSGIGVDEPAMVPSGPVAWLRLALALLVRLVPDLDTFNPARQFGEGEALGAGLLLAAGGSCLVVLLAVLLLGAATVPLKER